MSEPRFRQQFDVSRETIDDLKIFVDRLKKWNSKINLVSHSSIALLWERHIADSAQLGRYIDDRARKIVDLGSGGGFPAIVLAILSKRTFADRHFTLVESDRRKSAFLATISRELDLNTDVVPERAESLAGLNADILTCRGYAPLHKALEHVVLHLHPTGRAILPKGAKAASEISQARQIWTFTAAQFPSITDPEASILEIRNIVKKVCHE